VLVRELRSVEATVFQTFYGNENEAAIRDSATERARHAGVIRSFCVVT
jgi:hypothetical protein